jgi:iron complex transport system permease protein
VNHRPWLFLFLASVGMLLTVAFALCHGAVSLTLPQLGLALIRQGDPLPQTILWDLRLPRILASLIVGAALGMSGALLQGLLRNGLADPFTLGISAGAGLVSISLISLSVAVVWLPMGAWLGAMVTALVVFGLAYWRGAVVVERLILGGVAVSTLLGAIQTTLLLLSEDSRIQMALNWLIGSLNGRGWAEVSLVAPYVGVALILGCCLGPALNLLNLGDELAIGLGSSLMRSRLLIGAVASLLAAGAVSVAGLVGFIGLVVPHMVRLWVGSDYRWVLPLSAWTGAWVLAIADFVSRLGAVELPVGVVTALMGAPVFIGLLYRRGQR